jgi:hypothetical protein
VQRRAYYSLSSLEFYQLQLIVKLQKYPVEILFVTFYMNTIVVWFLSYHDGEVPFFSKFLFLFKFQLF